MSTKRLQTGCFVVSTELGILGQLGVFGQDRMEKVVYFIVVPCCHVPKPRDVDKKTPNLVFCGIDRAGYSGCFVVSTELGILGPLGILG